MITDASIKAALRSAPTSGKNTIELKDDGPRGEGRLALVIRVAKDRITPEWYAVWYVAWKRSMLKMGTYPTMSLGDARKTFSADYAPVIAKGQTPAGPRARKERVGVTVKDLFQVYVDHLKATKRPAAKQVERVLLTGGKRGGKPAVKALGANTRAADVTPQDIIPYLASIYERGSEGMALMARAYISAAFSYAMGSENSYTRVAGTVKWALTANPVAAIPPDHDARKPGQRYLNQAELHDFWHWTLSQDEDADSASSARMIIVTGQRVTEITRIDDKIWTPEEKMLDWGKTKNGKPHNLPVASLGVEIMKGRTPNKHGLYWPMRTDPTRHTEAAVLQLIRRYLKENPAVSAFTARDLRRTWKTLAGAAGITKEMRDRLQNHAQSDVSSKHYDRYDMLKERRAAVEVWNAYLTRIIAGEFKRNVVKMTGEAA